MATCFDVADFFLANQDKEAGDTISNMKLQKLCYYAQGFSLAMLNAPMFSEHIEAWMHGPVVPQLYQRYSQYGSGSIPPPAEPLANIAARFSSEQLKVLGDVYDEYGQYSAWRLRNFTHEEPPWIKHFSSDDVAHTEEIPLEDMKKYFLTQVSDEED